MSVDGCEYMGCLSGGPIALCANIFIVEDTIDQICINLSEICLAKRRQHFGLKFGPCDNNLWLLSLYNHRLK